MFLCEQDCQPINCQCYGRSHGNCESCNKVRICADCHCNKPIRKKVKAKKKK